MATDIRRDESFRTAIKNQVKISEFVCKSKVLTFLLAEASAVGHQAADAARAPEELYRARRPEGRRARGQRRRGQWSPEGIQIGQSA